MSYGLEGLIPVGSLKVKQRFGGIFSGNKYKIFTEDDVELLTAREDSIGWGGSSRAFDMTLQTPQGVNAIHLRRPYTWGVSKMEVSVGGVVVSVLRQKSTFMDTVIFINNAKDQPVMRFKGNYGYYELQTMDKKPIGGIDKKVWTMRDNYRVSFPHDLDVRFKAAVIGACIFIDFLKHED